MSDDDAGLARIAAAAEGGRGRTPLYRWMKERHDKLVRVFDRPDWEKVATEFQAMGLLGDSKGPATRARQTWWQVKRDVAKERGTTPGAVAQLAPAARLVPGRVTSALPGTDPEAAFSRMKEEMAERSGRKPAFITSGFSKGVDTSEVADIPRPKFGPNKPRG